MQGGARKAIIAAVALVALAVIVPPASGSDAVFQATWTSLAMGLFAAIVAVLIGAVIGFVGGYRGGRVEQLLNLFFTDLVDSVPQFIFLLILVKGAQSLIGDATSVANPIAVGISIGIANSTQVAALIMTKVKLVRERRFVKAAQLIGMPTRQILLRKIAPFCVSELVVPFTHLVGWSIFIETAMSYMRFGVSSPFTSLGAILATLDPIARPDERLLMAAICALTIGLAACLKIVGDGLHELTHRRADTDAPAPP